MRAQLAATVLLMLALAARAEDASQDPYPLEVGTEWTFEVGNEKKFPLTGAEFRFVVAEKKTGDKNFAKCSCGTMFDVSTWTAGQELECSVCKKVFQVPSPATWTRVDTYALGKSAAAQREYYTVDGDFVYLVRRAAVGASVDLNPPQPYLPRTLAEGKAWSWHGDFGDVETVGKFTVEAFEEVEVAAGKFSAWRVKYEWEMKDGTKVISLRWFAPGVGMIIQDDTTIVGTGSSRRIGKLKSWKAPERK